VVFPERIVEKAHASNPKGELADTRDPKRELVSQLRAETESFLQAAASCSRPLVSGEDGRRALALALRTLEQIHEHTLSSGVSALLQNA